jgi:hypothetical protein
MASMYIINKDPNDTKLTIINIENEDEYSINIKFQKRKSFSSRFKSNLTNYFRRQVLYILLSSWYFTTCIKCRSKIYCSEFCKFCGEQTYGKTKKNSKKLYIRLFCSRFIVIISIFALIFFMMLSKLIFSPLLDISFIKVGLLYTAFIIFLFAFQQNFIKNLPLKKVKNIFCYIRLLFRERFWLFYHLFLSGFFIYLLIKHTEWTLIYNLIFITYKYFNREIS